MKVAFEAQRMLRDDPHGMDVVARSLLAAMVARAPKVSFVAFTDRPDTRGWLPRAANLEVRPLSAPAYPLWEQVALPLALCRERFDVVHLTSNTAPVFTPCPQLVTVHDVQFMRTDLAPSPKAYQRWGRRYRRWNVPLTAPRAQGVCTVSHDERGRVADALGMPASQVDVVPNGVAPAFLTAVDEPAEATVRGRLGLPERYVLCLGNTAPKKNTDRVLAAWAESFASCRVPLVVAELSQADVAARLTRMGHGELAAQVTTPGYLDQRDLVAVYRGASVLLYPSITESFGLPILEAMACGAPVVTSNVTAMPEVAGDAALLVDPMSVDQIRDALVRVLHEPDLARSLQARGRERARRFRWEDAADKTLALYRKVVRATCRGGQPCWS